MRPEQPASRRSVLRTAAWSAPAVVVATAAPAHAMSLPSPVKQQIVLSIDDATLGASTMSVTVGFSNPARTATSAKATLNINFSQTLGSRGFPAEEPVSTNDVSWVFVGATPGGTITFQRVGIPAAPTPFTFVRRTTGTGSSIGSVMASGTADDASFVSGSGTWGV